MCSATDRLPAGWLALTLGLAVGVSEARALELEGALSHPNAEPVKLEGAWKMRVGDRLEWAEPDWDDSDWATAPTQFDAEDLPPGFEGSAWFRMELTVPQDLVRTELALATSQLGSIEVYIDGHRLASAGEVNEARLGGETAIAVAPMEATTFRFERAGRHVIAVRFASTWVPYMSWIGIQSGFGVWLSSTERADVEIRANRLGQRDALWFVGAMSTAAVLHLFLFFFRREAREYLYFALTSLAVGGIALSNLGIYFAELVGEALWFTVAFRVSLLWTAYFFVLFVHWLLYPERHIRRQWAYLALCCAGTLGAYWLPIVWAYVLDILMVLDALAILGRGVLDRRPGAVPLAWGGLLAGGGAILQMIPNVLGYPYTGSAYMYGFIGNLAVVSWLLAKNYARTHQELKEQMEVALNQERRAGEEELARRSLEARTQKQQVELEEAKKREEVLRQLEAAHRELKQTQAQLIQSGKMAALGQLVAGVAHEINTPVGAVASMHQSLELGLAKLRKTLDAHPELLEQDPKLEKTLGVLDEAASVIGSGSARVGKIVRRLRTFARLDEAEFKMADLNEGLQDTLTMAEHKKKAGVEVVAELQELPKIPCFPSQLNQVFLNLLVNALQALDGPDGRVVIRSRPIDSRHIQVEVEDDGCGIPPENLPKIFDPGFTTKGVKVGTGLGLSISYQIVSEHQGTIDVQSTPGEGTRFTVTLPTDLDVRLGRKVDA